MATTPRNNKMTEFGPGTAGDGDDRPSNERAKPSGKLLLWDVLLKSALIPPIPASLDTNDEKEASGHLLRIQSPAIGNP
jgi:hypothetical protein